MELVRAVPSEAKRARRSAATRKPPQPLKWQPTQGKGSGGAGQRGVERSELGGAAPGEAIGPSQPLKRQLRREAKRVMLSSAEPGEARQARRSAAARTPPRSPKRLPPRRRGQAKRVGRCGAKRGEAVVAQRGDARVAGAAEAAADA